MRRIEPPSPPTVRRKFSPAYAIVRIDDFHGPNTIPEDKIMVKEIVFSEEEAEAEVTRLRALNGAKGCRYFWQYTRLMTLGRIGDDTADTGDPVG